MKKIRILLAMLLSALLAGCTPEDVPQPTEPETAVPTEATEAPGELAEDVIYFANDMEFGRLYSVRSDGTDLKLVWDERCYDVRQIGDTVYCLTDYTLEGYHVPTGTSTVIAENVLFFDVDADYVVYALAADRNSFNEIDLRKLDLSTGSDTSIGRNTGRFFVGYGRVYDVAFDDSGDVYALYSHDLATGETWEIAREFESYGTVLPSEDGVYFEGNTGDAFAWYYAPAEGPGYEPVELPLDHASQLLQISGDGILYLSWEVETMSDALCHVEKDGTVRTLLQNDGDWFLSADPIGDGRWLVRNGTSIGWGETDEWGYYEKYAYRYEYYLLAGDGTLTPLPATGEVGSLFPEGDFPLMDSSTARIPVTTALYQLFVKNYGYEGPEPLCSTTHGAWLNIADRKVDLALLAAPTPEEQAYLDEQGVTVEMKLYGGDGLVFIGNAANPVTGLTHEQILAIYRGEITNWNQVGGPDHPIIVYYRDEQSGSQRLFQNLVFKGQEVPDFEAMTVEGKDVYLMDDMSSIVDVILSEPYAIGYSIMTYLDEVYAQDELRVFSVDGVLPSTETVAAGTYRYHTQGYLVIRSDEPADSPARRLFDWFGCPISDDLLTDCGVSPLHDGDVSS